jgi:hypothetical protein
MQLTLTSAQSARVVFVQAGSAQSNVTINVNRNASQLQAYTGTYSIPQPIFPSRLGSITATFYSMPSQGGEVVGSATSTASLSGTMVEFAPINLSGIITNVDALPATIDLGDAPTQLLFSAKNNSAAVVAVTPGSASWTVVSGSQFLSLTPDGIATPLAVGSASVQVTVDGVTSATAVVQVVSQDVPIYTWAGSKGGNLTTPTFDAVEGNQFQVTGGKDVVVTKLGYEATPQTQPTGITAIFDQNGTVLAQATITGSDTLINGYYYKDITPLTLSSGSTYYIGSLHGTGAAWNYFHNTNVAATPSFIVDLGTTFKVTSTIAGGTWATPGVPRHFVGNFLAHQAP